MITPDHTTNGLCPPRLMNGIPVVSLVFHRKPFVRRKKPPLSMQLGLRMNLPFSEEPWPEKWLDLFFSKPVALQMVHISCTNCECILYTTITYLAASSRLFLDEAKLSLQMADRANCKDQLMYCIHLKLLDSRASPLKIISY